ncbi:hypothetical protein [Micromonospora sp. CP22]|uniref:hypothetical protein n=1 Tax=Micromonospora sp. CP22 TaxID=2580517 RepID=UPI0012BC91FF|nr:hypothetical protein [Micromonospora sp. CP22]MTK04011.1 hypothetical protein [Micromonospora sp. CP22]
MGVRPRWPELESPPPSRGGRTGPDPWPALPDDRALWAAPEPSEAHEQRARWLDGEQAGG